jgi:hypothetical protein
MFPGREYFGFESADKAQNLGCRAVPNEVEDAVKTEFKSVRGRSLEGKSPGDVFRSEAHTLILESSPAQSANEHILRFSPIERKIFACLEQPP